MQPKIDEEKLKLAEGQLAKHSKIFIEFTLKKAPISPTNVFYLNHKVS